MSTAQLTDKQRGAIVRIFVELDALYKVANALQDIYNQVEAEHGINIDDIPGYSIAEVLPESLEEWMHTISVKIRDLKKLAGPKKLYYTGSSPFLQLFDHFEENVGALYIGVMPDGFRRCLDGTETHDVFSHHSVRE